MGEPDQPLAKLLPRNRKVLETMFEHCEECLRTVNRARHRNERLCELQLRQADGAITFPELKQHEARIHALREQELDDPLPDVESLWPYCDQQMLIDFKACALASDLLTCPDQLTATDARSADKIAQTYVTLITGQRLHILLLRGLKRRITADLSKSRADVGADTEAKLVEIAPRNGDISELHSRIVRAAPHGTPQITVALDFTRGNRAKANSLLRGVRRYRERIRDANH